MGQLWSGAAPMRPRPASSERPTKLAPTVQQIRPLQFDGMQTTGEAFDRAVEQLVLVPGREAAGFLSLDSPVLQAMLSGDATGLGGKLEVHAPYFDPEDKTLADLLTITSAVLSETCDVRPSAASLRLPVSSPTPRPCRSTCGSAAR